MANMISFAGINFLAVLVAAIVYFFIGFVWYSLLFGEVWRKETGVPADTTAKPKPGALAGQFASTFLYVMGVALVLNLADVSGIKGVLSITILITVFFATPMNSGNLFFTGRKKLFLIDVCERAIGTFVTAFILTLWK